MFDVRRTHVTYIDRQRGGKSWKMMNSATNFTRSPSLTFWESFRATFYLVTPSETVFQDVEDVPDYVASAVPHFMILILTEMAVLCWKGQHDLRINDKLTSIGAGMYSEILRILGLKSLGLSLYVHVYMSYRLFELPWDSVWTWVIMALTYDFLYYWFHRCAHEVHFLWNTHQTHHSSEDYTLPTALRQSAFQDFASMWFYLPAALFVPPSAFAVHRQLNLLYQFWIHTELIESLGPLEYVLNTPSHHRVHHGRNPYCIDKNYAAVLIIWDRMFGTFQAEKKDEKVVYGLVHNVNTFDSNAVQVRHYLAFAKRCYSIPGWYNKMCVIWKGPGWIPGSPRLGNPESIPKVEYPVKKYDPETSNWLVAYILMHHLLSVFLYNQALAMHLSLPMTMVIGAATFIFLTLTCIGFLFDKRSFAYFAEFLRCAACAVVLQLFCSYISKTMVITVETLHAVAGLYFVSAVLWPVILFRDGVQVFKEKVL